MKVSLKLEQVSLSVLSRFKQLEDVDNMLTNHQESLSKYYVGDLVEESSTIKSKLIELHAGFNKESTFLGNKPIPYDKLYPTCKNVIRGIC